MVPRNAGTKRGRESSLREVSTTPNQVSQIQRWVTSLAILGDSPLALALAAFFFLTSLAISLWIQPEQQAAASLEQIYAAILVQTNVFSWSLFSRAWNQNQVHVPLENQEKNHHNSPNLGLAPQLDPPIIYQFSTSLSLESARSIQEAYAKDGVVAVRGLISPDLLRRLDQGSHDLVQEQLQKQQQQQQKGHSDVARKRNGTQFFTSNHGVVYLNPPVFSSTAATKSFEKDRGPPGSSHGHQNRDDSSKDKAVLSPFLEVAVDSLVPHMAAFLLFSEDSSTHNVSFSQLFNNTNDNGNEDTRRNNEGAGLNVEDRNLRLIRDIFLAKDDDPYICGWHVDDFGFWPATPSSSGINAWIALDDMPLEHGGGFALAVGSHKASWRDEAHYVTGASTTSPPEGYESAKDMMNRRTGKGTCNIATSAPHLHARMEQTKRVYALRRGDVIFHDRWIFHRTIAFSDSFVWEQRRKEQQKEGNAQNRNDRNHQTHSSFTPPIYRRYSLRYGPGSSVVPPGYGMEPSVLWDPSNGGKTANQVCQQQGGYPWYLQAWPTKSQTELDQLSNFVSNQLSVAYERQKERKREMKPLLAMYARRQQQLQEQIKV